MGSINSNLYVYWSDTQCSTVAMFKVWSPRYKRKIQRWKVSEMQLLRRSLMKYIIDAFNDSLYRIKKIGKLPICNKNQYSAPHIFGFCFPLCWRCTSTIASMYVGGYTITTVGISVNLESRLFALLLILPMAIDGYFHYFGNVRSNNIRRIIFGSMAGIGVALVLSE